MQPGPSTRPVPGLRPSRRAVRRPGLAWPLALLSLLALGGCATPATPPATAAVAASGGAARYGTIVAIRKLGPLHAGAGLAGDPRGSILDALRGAVHGGERDATGRHRSMAEFIVRTDDGQPPTSVMQTDTPGLRLGQRVLLTSGAHTRIARAGG